MPAHARHNTTRANWLQSQVNLSDVQQTWAQGQIWKVMVFSGLLTGDADGQKTGQPQNLDLVLSRDPARAPRMQNFQAKIGR